MSNISLKEDFFSYIKKPKFNIKISKISFKEKIWRVFQLWSVALLFIVFFSFLFARFIQNSGYDVSQNKLLDLVTNKPFYFFVVLAFVWAPIIEEICFRLWLRYTPLNLSISLSVLSLLLLEIIIDRLGWSSVILNFIKNGWQILIFITSYFLLLIFFTYLLVLFFKRLDQEKIKNIYMRFFAYFFYISVFVFAFLHIYNYKQFDQAGLTIPLLVMPQFIIALFLGYVRMRFGFGWSMFLHFLHNSLLSLPFIFSLLIPSQILAAAEKGQAINVEDISGTNRLLVVVLGFFLFFVFFGLLKALWDFFKNKTTV